MSTNTPRIRNITLDAPDTKLRKKVLRAAGLPDTLFKRQALQMVIGNTVRYGSCANRALERLGLPADFTPADRVWGTRIKGTPFVEHKGQYYIEGPVLRSVGPVVYHDADGKIVDLPEGALPDKAPRTAQREQALCWRTVAVSSIVNFDDLNLELPEKTDK